MLELLESAQFTYDKANEITNLLRKTADYLHEKGFSTNFHNVFSGSNKH